MFTFYPKLNTPILKSTSKNHVGELGTASTVLSASLGHHNLDTVNNFYLSANHIKASSEANKMISTITSDTN